MGKSASASPVPWRRKLASPGRNLPARAEREIPMNPSLTSQLAADRRASLLAEARRQHQAAAAQAERGKAFGIYGAMLGFASAIGLVLGGVLTDANLFGSGWRSVFYVNVPVAVAALIAGARLVPETRDPATRRPNLPGAAILYGSVVACVCSLPEVVQL